MQHLRNGLGGLLIVIGLATPAFAQPQPSRPATGGDDRTMLMAAGLTFLNFDEDTGIGVAGNALFNALTVTDTGRIGIVVDAGINDSDGGVVTTFMGGLRYTFNTRGKVIPYGQFLVGLVHCCDDTDFSPNLAFGLDVAWRRSLNFRGELAFIFADADAARFFLGVSFPVRKQ